jgi:hypothetical protein
MMAATLVLPAGCDPGDEGELGFAGEVEFRPIGGVWLNTSSLGSLYFSALDLDGEVLDGLRLTDVLIPQPNDQWLRMDSIYVASGQIRGRRGGTHYTGAALLGSRWLLSPVQGAPVEMWISGYTGGAEARYTFQTLDGGGAPIHVCDPDGQGDYSAIPIKDITVNGVTGAIASRSKTLYLACVSGAVGKARKWGYSAHWLANFEVAVRMVRADYCFDGASWTVNGTGVQVRDAWDVNDFLHSNYATEAVWTAEGLACLTQPRRTEYSAAQVICDGAAIPTCPTDLSMATYPGALIWTKIGTPPTP